MKKKLISLMLVFCTLFITSIVSAKELSKDDIPNNSYVIGTHLFTRETSGDYKGTLTVQYIMLAAKTINSNSIIDMSIYYKNARGKWVDPLTGEDVKMEENIEIRYENTSFDMTGITLQTNCEYNTTSTSGSTVVNCSFYFDKYFEETYEIYEKNGDDYKYIDYGYIKNFGTIGKSAHVDFPLDKKTYVAKAYTTDINNNKIYSNYSNEVVINSSSLPLPTLISNCSNNECTLRINVDAYYEIYEKNGSNYTLVGSGNVVDNQQAGKSVYVNLLSEQKTYVARTYVEKDNSKIYSGYSNEVVLKLS